MTIKTIKKEETPESVKKEQLTDKDRVEAFVSLYKQQMDRFNKTQEVEWKANFGIWALLAGAIYLAAKEPVSVSPWFAGLCLFALAAMHVGWLIAVHASERYDKKLWARYRGLALDLIGVQEQPFKYSLIRHLCWLFLEGGMTAILCLVLFTLDTGQKTEPPTKAGHNSMAPVAHDRTENVVEPQPDTKPHK